MIWIVIRKCGMKLIYILMMEYGDEIDRYRKVLGLLFSRKRHVSCEAVALFPRDSFWQHFYSNQANMFLFVLFACVFFFRYKVEMFVCVFC